MLFRQGAGGIVFHDDRVLLLQDLREEWVFPRGSLENWGSAGEVAVRQVREGAGVKADIVAPAGESSYQVRSGKRRSAVCDQIIWFLMRSEDDAASPASGFRDSRFFSLEEALERLSRQQDRSLLRVAYEKMRKLLQRGA